MDDVFDENADELTVSNTEHGRIMENIEKVSEIQFWRNQLSLW